MLTFSLARDARVITGWQRPDADSRGRRQTGCRTCCALPVPRKFRGAFCLRNLTRSSFACIRTISRRVPRRSPSVLSGSRSRRDKFSFRAPLVHRAALRCDDLSAARLRQASLCPVSCWPLRTNGVHWLFPPSLFWKKSHSRLVPCFMGPALLWPFLRYFWFCSFIQVATPAAGWRRCNACRKTPQHRSYEPSR